MCSPTARSAATRVASTANATHLARETCASPKAWAAHRVRCGEHQTQQASDPHTHAPEEDLCAGGVPAGAQDGLRRERALVGQPGRGRAARPRSGWRRLRIVVESTKPWLSRLPDCAGVWRMTVTNGSYGDPLNMPAFQMLVGPAGRLGPSGQLWLRGAGPPPSWRRSLRAPPGPGTPLPRAPADVRHGGQWASTAATPRESGNTIRSRRKERRRALRPVETPNHGVCGASSGRMLAVVPTCVVM